MRFAFPPNRTQAKLQSKGYFAPLTLIPLPPQAGGEGIKDKSAHLNANSCQIHPDRKQKPRKAGFLGIDRAAGLFLNHGQVIIQARLGLNELGLLGRQFAHLLGPPKTPATLN